MTTDTEALAATIGGRVRWRRQERGWTLDRLADVAGLSRRVVVNVEQGSTNPSIGTLLRLSEALGMGLPALVDPPRVESLAVVRAGAGSPLWSGEHGGRGVLLTAATSPQVLELWDWTMRPGEEHGSEAHTTGTRELLHVLEGTLTLVVAGVREVLDAGDAAGFAGDRPHRYVNDGPRPARFSLAVAEPPATAAADGGHRG